MTSPTVVIRCESRPEIGLGHLSRMQALGDVLRRRGAKVRFLCDPNPLLEKRLLGFEISVKGAETEEAFLTQGVRGARVLVIDTKLYYSAPPVKAGSCRVVFFDRDGEAAAISDLVIHPGPWRSQDPRVLAGLEYVIINPVIRELLQERALPGSSEGPVVVTAGGRDPSRILQKLLEWLRDEKIPRPVRGLIGELFVRDAAFDLFAKGLKGNTRVVDYRPGELAGAGLAIATYGVTVYELLALGVPTVVVAHSEENAKASRALAESTGSIADLGSMRDLTRERFLGELNRLLEDPAERLRLSECGRKLVDGCGADRVAAQVLSLAEKA